MYYEKGRYIPQALGEINHILRDYRQNVVKPIHPALLDLVVANSAESSIPTPRWP